MMNTREMILISLCATLFCVACDTNDAEDEPPSEEQQQPLCTAETLASDTMIDPSQGDAGDPKNWGPFPPTAVVASTYLRLKPGADVQQRFGALVGPMIAELSAPAPGLMGLSTTMSNQCGVARTLTVWASEEAMMNFVMGDAHLKAVQAVGEVSRGGSITKTWSASEFQSFEWPVIAKALESHDGPVY